MKVLKYLSESLAMDIEEIKKFASTSPHRYKKYEIPKRTSNEMRVIAHPSAELKYIQRLLIKFLKPKLPIHPCAYAYRDSIGIKDNANLHVNSKYLLKMDFKDFFPSITPDLLFYCFQKIDINLDDSDKFILERIIFWKPKRHGRLELSIGAPTSPLISNFIMYFFDEKISADCAKRNINYSRYADDITFSTNEKDALFLIPDLVASVLAESTSNSIKVNIKKTVFSSKKFNRHVTGVTLNNSDSLSIGRERKREISVMIHKFSLGQLNEKDTNKLKGLLAYANHIDSNFYTQMKNKYGFDVMNKLIKIK